MDFNTARQKHDSNRWKGVHRVSSRRFSRKIVFVLAVVMAASGVAPLTESSTSEVSAAMVAPVTFEFSRETPASRSQRAALTRKQKIEKVISYAYAQRGDRYKWGASGPSRWDCSGLVSVAFKKGSGITLPHFTGGIQKRGKKVARKNLQRGDIIFPQRGHVGIYLGNGKMIHASSGKGKVVVTKVYGFYTARRVL